MSGITIIGVKIVGLCSNCRKKAKERNEQSEFTEILRDKNGRAYEDDEISCVGCALGGSE